MRSFAELLKKYRASAGMTQQQLGDRLKLSPPYIAQIESGLKPPPQARIVSRMAEVMHLDDPQAREFSEAAEYEREHQSLIRATRKLGYAVSGNHVLIPERTIWRAVEHELSDLFKRTELEAKQGMFVAGFGGSEWSKGSQRPPILRSRIEMQAWLLDYLGNEPSIGLAFMGRLYGLIRLTDDGLVLDEPTDLRRRILSEIADPGSVMMLLKSAIDDAKELVQRREHPTVLQGDEPGTPVEPQPKGGPGLRTVEVTSVLNDGSDYLTNKQTGERVELPASWLEADSDYQAVAIEGDTYAGLGLWRGSRAIVQREAVPRNEDLVVIRVGGDVSIKRYFSLGMDLFLQGGGPSSPTLQVRRDDDVVVEGVVRQVISRFGEMQRAKLQSAKEEKL